MGSRRFCRVPHSSARPHPKPAGRKSAAESREEHPADLHAGRFARRAQARVASERPASEFHPEPSRGRRRRDGGARKASPRRRPRHAAPAAGLWPKRGRPSPERREAERGSTPAARSAAPRGAEQGRTRSGGAKGAAYRGLGLVAAAGGRKAGLWGEAGAGGQARPRNGGLRKAGAKGEARPRRGGKGLWAFTSAIAWHSRGQRRF